MKSGVYLAALVLALGILLIIAFAPMGWSGAFGGGSSGFSW